MKNNISMQDFHIKYINEKITILDVREIHEYVAVTYLLLKISH